MSELVQYTGTLTKINIPDSITTLKDTVDYLVSKGYKVDFADYKNKEVYFYDLVQIGKDWYTYTKTCVEGIFEATKLPDGTIKYVVEYCTGGCSFERALEQAIKGLEYNE